MSIPASAVGSGNSRRMSSAPVSASHTQARQDRSGDRAKPARCRPWGSSTAFVQSGIVVTTCPVVMSQTFASLGPGSIASLASSVPSRDAGTVGAK